MTISWLCTLSLALMYILIAVCSQRRNDKAGSQEVFCVSSSQASAQSVALMSDGCGHWIYYESDALHASVISAIYCSGWNACCNGTLHHVTPCEYLVTDLAPYFFLSLTSRCVGITHKIVIYRHNWLHYITKCGYMFRPIVWSSSGHSYE
jgi:hypothetical protein